MEKQFPVVVLSLFLIRPIYSGASIGDAFVIIGLAALYAGHYYLESKKEPVANKALLDRLVDLEEQVRITKDVVNGVKLSSTFRR